MNNSSSRQICIYAPLFFPLTYGVAHDKQKKPWKREVGISNRILIMGNPIHFQLTRICNEYISVIQLRMTLEMNHVNNFIWEYAVKLWHSITQCIQTFCIKWNTSIYTCVILYLIISAMILIIESMLSQSSLRAKGVYIFRAKAFIWNFSFKIQLSFNLTALT